MTDYADLVKRLRERTKVIYGSAGVFHVPPQCVADSLCAEAADAIEALARETQWRPIETAPKDGTVVLFWSTRDGVCIGRWVEQKYKRWEAVDETTQRLAGIDDYSDWCANNGDSCGMWSKGATHWLPLPARPEGSVTE